MRDFSRSKYIITQSQNYLLGISSFTWQAAVRQFQQRLQQRFNTLFTLCDELMSIWRSWQMKFTRQYCNHIEQLIKQNTKKKMWTTPKWTKQKSFENIDELMIQDKELQCYTTHTHTLSCARAHFLELKEPNNNSLPNIVLLLVGGGFFFAVFRTEHRTIRTQNERCLLFELDCSVFFFLPRRVL